MLSIAEVRSVLAQLDGTAWLLANVLYGGGLRLMEAQLFARFERQRKLNEPGVSLPTALARKYPIAGYSVIRPLSLY